MRLRLVVLSGAVLGLAACGGGGGSSATPTTGASTTVAAPAGGAGGGGGPLTSEQQQQLQAYRQCLQDNGAGFGGRRQGGGGQGTGGSAPAQPPSSGQGGPPVSIDPAVLAKAQEACKDKLPAGVDPATVFGRGQGGGGQGAGQGAGRLNQLQPYLTCLRDNGVDVAVPAANGQAPQGSTAGNIPPTTEAGQGTPGQGQGGRGGVFGGLDRTSPAFQAANEKCKVLLPEGFDPTAGPDAGNRGGGPGQATTTTAPKG